MPRLALCVAMVACCLVVTLSAQTSNATLSGTVTDPSGAVIPNVSISIRNEQTNVVHSTRTNPAGYYTAANLIPGAYTLTASSPGMKNMTRSGIVLRVGDRIALDISMEVGAQSELVTVVGETPLLRTEDSQLGLVIDNRRIQELPQYDRNALAFALLTPNVNNVTSPQTGHDNDFRINGGRTSQAEYLIDGVPVTTGYRHDIPPSVPSMEAIGEFKVVTNGLSAEYGRLSGGAVTMVTRSGTNDFHGSAYWYFRNDRLNANDWNSNRFGRKKGVFHENVPGFTFGGPVRIPKVYNGRDKTFFFLNYEGLRLSSGSNAALTGVPTDLERTGDFSQSLIDQGVPVQIFDPLTGRIENNRVIRNPFPGNRVPDARINPLAKIYVGYYPKANNPPRPNSSHDQNFIGSTRNRNNNNRWTGRLDENWSATHATHFTLTHFEDDRANPRWLSPLQEVYAGARIGKTISLEHVWTMNPTTVLSVRGGLVRFTDYNGREVDADASSWPMQDLMVNLLGTKKNRVPNIAASGDTLAALGGGSVDNTWETNYMGAFSVQKLMGKHTLKFGYEHRRYYSNRTSGGNLSMSSQRSVTSRYFDEPTTGSPFASFLLGATIWGQGTQLAGPASLQTYHGAFVQDDFKINRKLTLNIGLRWDFEPPRTERFDRQIYWDKDYKWPVVPSAGWSWAEVLRVAGVQAPQPDWLANGYEPGRVAMLGTKEYPGRHSQATFKDHFAPRLGIAYQFLPRTVLRAGYGMNWLTTTGGVFLNGAPWNVGYGDFARFLQGGTPDNGLTFPLTFDQPMPNGVGYVAFTRDIKALNDSLVGNWFISNSWNQSPGYEHAVQFGIQRELGSGPNSWVVDVSYNGNFGRSLPFWLGTGEHILPDAFNKLGPYGAALNTPVPNPIYGQIPATLGTGPRMLPFGRMFSRQPFWFEAWTMGEPLGTSNYNSGYVQVEHRFGHGFTFLANYTLAKLLQDVGGIDNQFSQGPSQQAFPQAGLGMGDIYGIATTDITHKVLFNYSWDLPFGKGRRFLTSPQTTGEKVFDHIAGGWRVAGTTTLRSGQPILIYTPSGGVGGLGSQWYNIGHGRTTRPRIVLPQQPFGFASSGHEALEGAADYKAYMNPQAFRLVQGFEIGDVGSTFPNWRGPGYSQWDLSVLKNFNLGSESRYLQIRFEAQNLFNHMNAAMPNGAVTQRTFGMITGQTGSPRRVMIAAKFYF
jgi:hypothetical protein